MVILSLLWLLIGILIGILASAAQLQPTSWAHQGWLVMLGIAALAALLGGWLGVLLLGKYFATATALWIAVLSVILVPRLATWMRIRFGAKI